MSDARDIDPDDEHGSGEATTERGRDTRRRKLVESVIPEILKRAVEIGVEKASEAPDNLKQFVNDRKLPKEIAHYLLQQIDETKNGLFRVVAKEMRDFLEQTNFTGELQKLLTTVQFEVNTTIRFTPNDTKPGAKADKDKAEASARDEAPETAPEAGGEAPTLEHDRAPLPRPEVKTSVSVRRDSSIPPRRG